jgi:glycolate oxidase FAD binding subunit
VLSRTAATDCALRLWGPACQAIAEASLDAPSIVLEPPDVPTLAAMLQWADRDRITLAPRGGGTKWGRISQTPRIDAVLSTRRLNEPVVHCPGDLTATLPAGATLAAVNDILGRQGQRLPLDPIAGDRATVGGIVATNDSGPGRLKHGSPRDLIIGIEMVLADGRMAKAGGRVVKNVAGYDLARLLCGSLGSLAVITRATFRLAPVAPASRTLVAQLADSRALGDVVLALIASPLVPAAIELESPPSRILVRFETTEQASDQQAAVAGDLCSRHGAIVSIARGKEEEALWREYETGLSGVDAASGVVKVAVLPTDLGATVDHAHRAAGERGIGCGVTGRAALSVLFMRFQSPDEERLADLIADVRRDAVARRGSAVLLAAPPRIMSRIDRWGDIGSGHATMRALKARFDPHGILNPGRGPGNL